MRMRRWATMRRPASSITALILPVRFRLVASGLMIEKVRSVMSLFASLNWRGEERRAARWRALYLPDRRSPRRCGATVLTDRHDGDVSVCYGPARSGGGAASHT